MNILGVSCHFHDAAAALLQDGKLVAATEEERLSRVKHDASFPRHAIEYCLHQGGVDGSSLDFVVFYEKPLQRFDRILMNVFGTFPKSSRLFNDAAISWFDRKLWIKSHLMKLLDVPPEKVLFVEHHMAHAASAFFCSPFRQAAVLTVDGVGEWTTATRGTATANWDGTGVNQIQLTEEMRFPHSLGLLYSAFTAWLGFEVNEGEYKVMGMAPYGAPRYIDKVEKVAKLAGDGSLMLNLDYFSFHHSATRSYTRKFEQLFGPPRRPESHFITRNTDPEIKGAAEECERNQYYADVAASIQWFTEEALVRMASSLQRSTGLDSLCMAGGVALNSMANARILRESGFKHLFVQPAAGDSGGAVGAALYAWHVCLGKRRSYVMETAYLGCQYSEKAIEETLRRREVPYISLADEQKLCEITADALVHGHVVGWFQGRLEWGPRALGNRSILADPRRAEMKKIINNKIKFREPFRPFAPVMSEQTAARMMVASKGVTEEFPARFMLLVLPWSATAAPLVPAVNHLGTGRVQTLRPEWNQRYNRLLESFTQATGVPVLLNTSFNLRGEPIVASPDDALNTFFSSGIDMLVLGHCIIRKPRQGQS